MASTEQVTSVYDGTTITFRMLRALGWGPQLLNLGYYGFSGPLTFINMNPGRLRLSVRQIDLVAKAAKVLNPTSGDTIVDVACGRGFSSFFLAHLVPGLEVTGIDLLPENIQVATTVYKNTPGLSYQMGSAMKLPHADSSVDKVFCLEAAFHFPDKSQFLKEAFRILRPGGCLVLVDFAWHNAAARTHSHSKERDLVCKIWGYEDFFTEEEYDHAGSQAGFCLEQKKDWTAKVTRPLLTQFKWLCALGRSSVGRKLLTMTNDQLRTFSKRDWVELTKSEAAHRRVHENSKYLTYRWVKPK